MNLPLQAIGEYEKAITDRYARWTEYMCGRIEAREVGMWPPHPIFPPESIPPEPLAVWIHRPHSLPEGLKAPHTYDLKYKLVDFEGLKFRPYTGRSTEGRNSRRHGRLNWAATFAARDAWEKETFGTKTQLETILKKIVDDGLKDAFSRIPHVTMVHGPYEYHLFQYPYDKSFGVASCYDGQTLYLPHWFHNDPLSLEDALKSMPRSNKLSHAQMVEKARALFQVS